MIDETPDEKLVPREVVRQMTRVEGFLDLKMGDRAAEELESIDYAYRSTLQYRWLQLNLMMLRGQWHRALPLARKLREDHRDEAGFWVQEAFVTRRALSLSSAQAILENALERFPDEAVIHYNLACYACQQGRRDEALQRLKDAVDIDEKWLKAAVNDEDLEPVQEEIEQWLHG